MTSSRPSEPEESEPPAHPADARAVIQAELLRLSTQPSNAVLAFQFALDCAIAALFAWLYSPAMALLWIALIAASTAWRALLPQRLPPTLDATQLPAQLRQHTTRIAVHEGVHGLAGVLLFDTASPVTQLMLGLVMMGMTLSSSFSVSYVARTMQMAIALLLGPLIIMALAFGAPPMMGLAALGAGLVILMWGQVAERSRKLEDSIGQRHDESERRAQALIGLQAAELAQAERLRFFSAANHDLRQPVMAIGLQAEVLQHQLNEGAEPATLQATLDALGRAQSALEGLTQQLLEIGRIEAGADPLHFSAVRLAPLLDQFAQGPDGRVLRIHCPREAVGWSDAVALRRIVANLVDNALKFTPRNGRVMVACRRSGPDWRIEVRDNGIGIAAEEHERVFGDFEQVGNAARNLRHGHGLGLAIVRRLAHRLGTRITLRSSPGRGATFAFEVTQPRGQEMGLTLDADVDDGDSELPGAGIDGEAPIPPGLAVLMVEDNAVVAESLAALLRHWQVQVQIFGSADELLESGIDLNAVDLALCDIRLPGGMDGVRLAHWLHRKQPTLKIALVSADIDEPARALARDRGWFALRKPVRPRTLRTLLLATQAREDSV